jgi:hypothetical protein
LNSAVNVRRVRFDGIADVQASATRRLWTYNHEHPNMALGGTAPIMTLAKAAWLAPLMATPINGGLPEYGGQHLNFN